MVYADLGKIQQVLYNLIDNAIKFSHEDRSFTSRPPSGMKKSSFPSKTPASASRRTARRKSLNVSTRPTYRAEKIKRAPGWGLRLSKRLFRHMGKISTLSAPRAWGRNLFSVCRRRRRYSKLKLSNPFAITANLPSASQ